MHIFGKGAGARGGDGGERGQSFNKSAVNAVRETKIFNKRSLVMLAARQERGERGEHCSDTLLLPCNCPFNINFHINFHHNFHLKLSF